jgi:hypothetical protein
MAGVPANKEWNFSVASVLNNEVTRAQKTVEDNFLQIRALAPDTVLNVRSGQTKQTQAKFAVQGALESINGKTKTTVSIIDAMLKNQQDERRGINGREEEIKHLKAEVQKERELAALRKEQAEALKQKYVGNFHSSWFGLWRPLTEQSRVGLLVTSILFGVVSLMSIGFFIYLNRQSFGSPASLTTASSSGIRNLYSGGFRFHK